MFDVSLHSKVAGPLGTADLALGGRTKPVFRGLIHMLAFASALTLAPILIVVTPGIADRFIVAIYALSIVGLFGVSALYHRIDWNREGGTKLRKLDHSMICLLYTSPSPRDKRQSRMPSSA